MAVTVTDIRTVRSEADTDSADWTGTVNTNVAADGPPIEASNSLTANVGATIFDSYHAPGGTVDLSNSVIYAWVFSRLNLGNTNDANGGLMIYVGDATNAGAWKVAGADRAAFRHDAGPVGWQCPALDTQNLPASPLSRVGSAASVNFAAVARVGTTVNSLIAAPGMNATYIVDIIRILNPATNDGCALVITSGSSSNPATFLDVVEIDRSTGSLQAHGIIRELGAGAYGCQGPLMFGTGSGTVSTWFEDKSVSLIFEDRGFRNTLYKIVIRDNGSGTTTFKLGDKVGTGTAAVGNNGCVLTAPPGVGASFDSQTDTNVTDVFIYGSTFNGFSNGIKLGGNGQEFIGNIVNQSGTIIPSGTLFYNNNINESIASSSLYWNSNLDTDGYIDGCSFLGSGSNSHAIEYGPNTPVSTSLAAFFENYGADSASNAAIYNNSGKDLYINISQGYDEPTIRNGAGASTRIVAGLTTVTLTGLVSGSEVRVMAAGTANELAGTEGVATFPTGSFPFSLSQDTQVDIVVHNIQYEYLRINNFTIPANTTSIPIEQRFDRNYSNP